MTLDSFNEFTVTVTPQSVLWKYSGREFRIYRICRKPLINAQADVFSEARGLHFDLRVHLYPYFAYASSGFVILKEKSVYI